MTERDEASKLADYYAIRPIAKENLAIAIRELVERERAKEREECAGIADAHNGRAYSSADIAAAIRARKA